MSKYETVKVHIENDDGDDREVPIRLKSLSFISTIAISGQIGSAIEEIVEEVVGRGGIVKYGVLVGKVMKIASENQGTLTQIIGDSMHKKDREKMNDEEILNLTTNDVIAIFTKIVELNMIDENVSKNLAGLKTKIKKLLGLSQTENKKESTKARDGSSGK